MKNLDIIIIGAGIGGLTAALALLKSGFRVAIYEQASELGEVGAGLTISPNGRHVLDHLMGEAAMDEICHVPRGGATQHFRTGEVLVDTRRGTRPKDQYGAAYCQVHRADLHGALVAGITAFDTSEIHTEYGFESLSETEGAITANFANGRQATGDLLIGCDGIRSQVRNVLWGAEEVRYTGYVAWRGIVAADRLPDDFIHPDSASFVGHGQSFTRYKVRQGRLINYVGLLQRDEWEEESWSVRSEVSELLAIYKDFCEEVRTIISATPPELCYKWGLFDRDPLPQWTKGRATLLGDAAHPMTPFLGQGAVIAIEDGMVLARALEASGVEGLQRYEAARRERSTMAMLKSFENAGRMGRRDPDNYTPDKHMSAESLGMFDYNPVSIPI